MNVNQIITNTLSLVRNVYNEGQVSYGFHKWLLRNYSGSQPVNENICLMLIARDDTDPTSLFRPSLALFRMHNNPDVRVVYREFTSVKSINTIIKKIARKNQIVGLSIECHGSSFNMEISSKKNVDLINISFLSKSFRLLAPSCVIVLKSCSTGKMIHQTCIAKMISEIAPGRLVIAPSADIRVHMGTFVWIDEGKLSAEFISEYTSNRDDFIGQVQDIVYKILFASTDGYYGYSCTEKFQCPL